MVSSRVLPELLLAFLMDEFTRHIQDEVPRYKLFDIT